MNKPRINYHHPKYLPLPKLDLGLFALEWAEAEHFVGLLRGEQKTIQNTSHLISPLITKEAEISSKIEGTQSSSEDIYMYAAGNTPAHKDTPVVSNYRKAMFGALNMLKDRKKITKSLIKGIHKEMLEGTEFNGVLGNFRDCDVWIANKKGDPIEKALYVPPEPVHVDSYMDNIVDFINNNVPGEYRDLVKTAIIHYQFEAVHPFEDGNGRIGRLLVPLILHCKGYFEFPIIYISGYFEAHPNEYRKALRDVDSTRQYEPWVKFFLKAITYQSQKTLELIRRIRDLHEALVSRYESSKSPYMRKAIDALFDSPVITKPILMSKLNINKVTANRLVEGFVADGILFDTNKTASGRKGARLYTFVGLLSILK